MNEEFPFRVIAGPLLFTVGVCVGYGLLLFRYLREGAGRRDRAGDAAPPPVRPPKQAVGRADVLIACGIAVTFYLLGLWRLGTPTVMYFDEVHHVRAAMEYVEGLDPHEWTHPPLAKLVMAASMKAWGSSFDPRDGAWTTDLKFTERATIGWRFPSVVFGALALLALYALARSLFDDRQIAVTATTLFALDGLFFVQARIAMTNIYTVCFLLAGTLGTWLYVKHGRKRWLLLTGLALGLALASRWTSLWAWGLNGLLLLWHLWTAERPRWAAEKRLVPGFAGWVARVACAMILLPLSLYALAYVPNVLQSPGGDARAKLLTHGEPPGYAPDWRGVFRQDVRARGRGWYKVVNLQGDMWRYHSELKEGHPYSAPWWSWPLLLRPTWYHFESPDGRVVGIWAIGNAFLWWAAVGALAACAHLARRDRVPALGLVALFGLGMWLAWAIKPRPLIFMHYFFESVPFVCIALAYLWWRLGAMPDEAPRAFARWHYRLVGAWFVFYYPLLSALPIPDWYFRAHLWLGRIWI